MNNLTNIVVYIKDEAMLQEAREILLKYEEQINKHASFTLELLDRWNYLMKNSRGWFLSTKSDTDTEITLTELEQLLKQNRHE